MVISMTVKLFPLFFGLSLAMSSPTVGAEILLESRTSTAGIQIASFSLTGRIEQEDAEKFGRMLDSEKLGHGYLRQNQL